MKGSDIATVVLACATVVLAIAGVQQSCSNEKIVDIMRAELQLSNRTKIRLMVYPGDPAISPVTMERLGEKDERWLLPYFIHNTGDLDVTELQYFHRIDYNLEVPSIDSTDWSKGRMHFHKTIEPLDAAQCGQDPYYRAQALDDLEEGRDVYRHLMVQFKDEMGTTHAKYTTWRLESYKIGDLPKWVKADNGDIK